MLGSSSKRARSRRQLVIGRVRGGGSKHDAVKAIVVVRLDVKVYHLRVPTLDSNDP